VTRTAAIVLGIALAGCAATVIDHKPATANPPVDIVNMNPEPANCAFLGAVTNDSYDRPSSEHEDTAVKALEAQTYTLGGNVLACCDIVLPSSQSPESVRPPSPIHTEGKAYRCPDRRGAGQKRGAE
jgi:hypothetical protein